MDNLKRIDQKREASASADPHSHQEVVILEKELIHLKQIVWSLGIISFIFLLGLAALNVQLFFQMQAYSYKIDNTSNNIRDLQISASQSQKDFAASSVNAQSIGQDIKAISTQLEKVSLRIEELEEVPASLGKLEASMLEIEKTGSANVESIKKLVSDEKALFQRVDLLKDEVDLLKYTAEYQNLD